MTPDALPEGFEAWPKDVQKRWLEEYHALYFPNIPDDRLPNIPDN